MEIMFSFNRMIDDINFAKLAEESIFLQRNLIKK